MISIPYYTIMYSNGTPKERLLLLKNQIRYQLGMMKQTAHDGSLIPGN